MTWIKTSERLPERVPNQKYSQVWCLCVHEGEVQVLVFNHEHMVWDDRSGDDFFCSIGDVSHWMLLPEAPTEEQGESAPKAPNTTKVETVTHDARCYKCIYVPCKNCTVFSKFIPA